MPVGDGIHKVEEGRSVNQVTVLGGGQLLRSTGVHIRGVASTHMGHDDTVRRVDVEGLRFGVI